MQLFYQPNIEKTSFLNEEDSRHCVKVLRHNNGDTIHVVDGMGGLFTCMIAKADAKKCELKITNTEREWGKRDRYLHIAIAPTKNADRLEWFIEKATEIGIDEISLILTKNSERRFQKTERLEKIAISGMKQSLKAYLPKINELTDYKKFIESPLNQQKLIAHLEENTLALSKTTLANKVCVLIGPEGDFTQQEIDLAKANGFEMVTLGNARLRTETAALVATTLVNNLY